MSIKHPFLLSFVIPDEKLTPIIGTLKSTPNDFVVNEILNEQPLKCSDFTLQSLALTIQRQTTKPSYEGINTAVIETWIAPHFTSLHALNQWIHSYVPSSLLPEAIIIPAPSDSLQRKMIFEYLYSHYKYLAYTTCTPSEAPSIHIAADTTYLPLFTLLPLEDIIQVYTFKNSHGELPSVTIGRQLTKEQRATVYKTITQASRNMDSRTVDVPHSASKAMCLFWKKAKGAKRRLHDDTLSTTCTPAGSQQPLVIRENAHVYVHFTLCKRDIEQLDAFQRLLETLPGALSLSDFAVAGIKDKRAVTTQRVSLCIHNDHSNNSFLYEQRVYAIVTRLLAATGETAMLQQGYMCSDITFTDTPLAKGALWGNEFSILLRNLDAPQALPLLTSRLEALTQYGFLNLYGSQRMGLLHDHTPLPLTLEHMPASPHIGKLLLCCRYKEAIDAIILGDLYLPQNQSDNAIMELDDSNVNNARRMYLAGGALPLILRLLSPVHTRERVLIKGLIRFGTDSPLRVLQLLPYSAITLYISAYQSYLWNLMCSHRIAHFGLQPIPGDLIVDLYDSSVVNVITMKEISACTEAERKELMNRVILPLFGSRSLYPSNAVGAYYRELLMSEGLPVSEDAGQVHATSAVVSSEYYPKGAYRTLLQTISHASLCEVEQDAIEVKFRLKAGSYATAFLRELTCNHGML